MIPKDKLQHVAMGAGACVVLAAVHYLPVNLAMLIGAVAFGVFYELQQWYRKEGQPDVWDAVATALPGLAAYVALEVFKWTR